MDCAETQHVAVVTYFVLLGFLLVVNGVLWVAVRRARRRERTPLN